MHVNQQNATVQHGIFKSFTVKSIIKKMKRFCFVNPYLQKSFFLSDVEKKKNTLDRNY